MSGSYIEPIYTSIGVEPSHGAVDSRSNPTTATRRVPLAAARATCTPWLVIGAKIQATTKVKRTAQRICLMRPSAFLDVGLDKGSNRHGPSITHKHGAITMPATRLFLKGIYKQLFSSTVFLG
jgi:hypothetical protein